LKNKRGYCSYPIFRKDCESFFAQEDTILESHKPIYGFDILTKNVDATKKNAKIAGVIKDISISRVEVDWMDMKVEKVDCIVSAPPLYSSLSDIASVDKIYKQLFHRAKDILSKKGVIVLLVNQPNTVISLLTENFTLIENRMVYMGQSEYFCLKIGWKEKEKKERK
jgi:23S rRNA G2445 N2-methylase RlmL